MDRDDFGQGDRLGDGLGDPPVLARTARSALVQGRLDRWRVVVLDDGAASDLVNLAVAHHGQRSHQAERGIPDPNQHAGQPSRIQPGMPGADAAVRAGHLNQVVDQAGGREVPGGEGRQNLLPTLHP